MPPNFTIRWNDKRFRRLLTEELFIIASEVSEEILKEIKANAPVDTGALRESLLNAKEAQTKDSILYRVGFDHTIAHYVGIVEFLHTPFMRPVVRKARRNVRRSVPDRINRLLRRLDKRGANEFSI